MTTQLEVLNHVLTAVGETPVSNVNSNHPTAQSALAKVISVSKQFQGRGWWFNMEECLVLAHNPFTGEVIVPSTTLKVDPVDTRSALFKRGNKLYDRRKHTYNIGEDVTVNLWLLLPTEELPEVAAQYLMAKAAYDFYVADDGDKDKAQALLYECTKTEAAVKAEQLQMSNVNALNRPTALHLRSSFKQFGGSYNPNLPGGGH